MKKIINNSLSLIIIVISLIPYLILTSINPNLSILDDLKSVLNHLYLQPNKNKNKRLEPEFCTIEEWKNSKKDYEEDFQKFAEDFIEMKKNIKF